MAGDDAVVIDHVRAPGGGRIGLVRCPGTRAAGLLGLARRPDLDTELRQLRAWPARALVTLVEPWELSLLGVDELGERARAVGFEWFHLPIIDGAAPGSRFEAEWPATRPRLHAVLDADERIIIHCRAGLGRTGTVAAQLLVERGMDRREAIRTVRDARPGAIESDEQVAWILRAR